VPSAERVIPFPRTRDWASALPPVRWTEFAAFHYAVRYHLNWAEELADRARRIVYKDQWAVPDFGKRTVRLLSWDVDEAAFLGGVAILEAGASLDCTLQLVNYVLGLGVKKKRVSWNMEPRDLQTRLAALTDARAPALFAALKRVYGSIGYDELGRYRN